MELLIGCGRSRVKKMHQPGREAWNGLVTLDMNPDVQPDVVHFLDGKPLPFPDDSADEIHAYDVLEHLADQGNWLAFFTEFRDFWRVLKPGGLFFAIVPAWDGCWAWGDPGHRRVIQPETLSFLDRTAYAAELDGEGKTNRTDYRFCWNGDFELVHSERHPDLGYAFALRAHKPVRA